jgi:hypothetical protein
MMFMIRFLNGDDEHRDEEFEVLGWDMPNRGER